MIYNFDGKYSFLSNFHNSPIAFDGFVYPTTEHFFHSFKTEDEEMSNWIREAIGPGEAKARGRKVKLRSDWAEIRYGVMKQAVLLKFTQHPDLKKKLIDTGDNELVEGNSWHDNIWGECYCDKCNGIEAENLLGKILMQVREEIKEERRK